MKEAKGIGAPNRKKDEPCSAAVIGLGGTS